MPELPDIVVYLDALRPRILGERLTQVQILSPFVLRTADPPISAFDGRMVRNLRRLGKRIVLEFDDEYFLVIHLMIAGRLRWRPAGKPARGPNALATFTFPRGTVLFTEASKKHRASLHAARGEAGLGGHDPGGIDVLESNLAEFQAALRRERHTLKRALTDPRLFSGIGNAYSDEILHAAKLSPLQLTTNLADDEIGRLHDATRRTLREWTERLRADVGDGFPEKVTAFRDGMAVHGRYRKPCPLCGSPVQRIRYAENEANYCATCQTGGRVLADRGLSRLLKDDWPRSLDEWEERMGKPA